MTLETSDSLVNGAPVRYYISEDGIYHGSWDAAPPEGLIEVDWPPEYADQIWQFPGWGASKSEAKRREAAWVDSQMDIVADQLLMHDDEDDLAIATRAEWVDYRKALRRWTEGAEGFPEIAQRPVRPA